MELFAGSFEGFRARRGGAKRLELPQTEDSRLPSPQPRRLHSLDFIFVDFEGRQEPVSFLL
jgi:hypothetical protein